MYNDDMKQVLVRMVNAIKNNQTTKCTKVTLFLGAGCSLTSSDTNISTYGIIKDLVAQYSYNNEEVPNEWNTLYRKFVNTVWNGQGEQDKINLLSKYFDNMQPSIGYNKIRYLVEHNYVDNIITTNFDPMLERVFNGLSYTLQVGTHIQIVGTAPSFTLLKAHGDLQKGELRFDPSELYRLPSPISSKIKELTGGIVIIIGYRGQDMGIIHSLNESLEHSAYWITYDRPDFYDSYDNGPIYNWLKKRNSERNLLYGNKFGDFDTILSQMELMLQDNTNIHSSEYYGLWKKCYLHDYFLLNQRFQQLFEILLNILEDYIRDYNWISCAPYYANSCQTLTQIAVNSLNDSVIPSDKLYCITNEVDALILALSFQLSCITQGYPLTAESLIDHLHKMYKEEKNTPIIGENFWCILKKLTILPSTMSIKTTSCDISFAFDSKQNYQAIVNQLSVNEFLQLQNIVFKILYFRKTSSINSDVVIYSSKERLENHTYTIVPHDGKVNISLNKMPLHFYEDIYDNLLKQHFKVTSLGTRYILHYDNIIYANFDINEQSKQATFSIMDEIWECANKRRKVFTENTLNKTIQRQVAMNLLENFLDSESNGFFIIGESGIGKTSLLENFIENKQSHQLIFSPTKGIEFRGYENIVQELFDSIISKNTQLEYLNTMLKQRSQELVIIVDSLDSIDASFQEKIRMYQELLVLCDYMSSEKINHIKIIVTARTDFYYQLQSVACNQPSPNSFCTIISPNNSNTTVFELPPFTDSEVNELIKMYNFDLSNSAQVLAQKYGDIIYTPLFLNMICSFQTLHAENLNEYKLYQIWYNYITQTRIANSNINFGVIENILEYIVCRKYFSHKEEHLTTIELFIDITDHGGQLIRAYEWLCKNSILKNITDNNRVIFSHDKVETYFVTRYMESNYELNFSRILQYLREDKLQDTIIRGCFKNIFEYIYQKDVALFQNSVIQILSIDNIWITESITEFLIHNIYNSKDTLKDILKCIECYISKYQMESFIRLIHTQIINKIDSLCIFDIQIIEYLYTYVNESIIGLTPIIKASNYYAYAKYIYIYPTKNVKHSYSFAVTLCESTIWRNLLLPPKLVDMNSQLLACLLRTSGDLISSIKLMNSVYQNLIKHGYYDDACRSILELGAMYREMTQFDKALKLYGDFDVKLLSDKKLEYRLYMNTGIIHKNLVQNDISENNINIMTHKNYSNAKDLFDQVYIFSIDCNEIPLQLEIIAELIECATAGYFLHLETIAVAKNYVKEMDLILPKYPVPIRRIQSLRMWARVLCLEGNPLIAIDKLRKGFEIAEHYKIPFRAADCCNQISSILCDNIESDFISKELLAEGLRATEYSINYYEQLDEKNHYYLKKCKYKHKVLLNKLNLNYS